MSVLWEQVVIEARDPARLGQWWAEVLDWVVVNSDPAEFEIRPAPERFPGLLFARTDEGKKVKNRLHLDWRPDDQDQAVERFVKAGASRIDIGQHDVSWVVLADPEGNEFCVLSASRSD